MSVGGSAFKCEKWRTGCVGSRTETKRGSAIKHEAHKRVRRPGKCLTTGPWDVHVFGPYSNIDVKP